MSRVGMLPVVLVAALAGLAHAWSVALPWSGSSAWWLQIASLAALCALMDSVSSKWRAATVAWGFGSAWLCGCFWWMYTSMYVYGGLPWFLAALAVMLLASALSLYLAIACLGYKALSSASPIQRAALFASFWLLAELARGRWFTGLPWGAAGYAHIEGPLSAMAPWIGVYGIGFAAAFTAALLASVLAMLHRALRGTPALEATVLPSLRRRVKASSELAAGLGLVVALSVGLHWADRSFTAPAGRLSVSLLQGNIAQDEKFMPGSGLPLALAWYAEQLQAANGDLVVAPETAIPILARQLPSGYWESINKHFAQGEKAALIGMPVSRQPGQYSNAVIGLAPSQPSSYQYDKHHLVPFGEFIPPMFRWFTEMMQIPLGDFVRGPLGQAPFEWKGQRIAPNVCYEDLFGEELAVRFNEPGRAPTMFANLSNIAWFGEGIAIDQHLGISRMRAIEFERPFVRATNTGATAIIDHRGVVTHILPRATRGVLRGEIEGRTGLTPYALWVGAVGLGPFWLLASAVVFAAAMRRRRA